MNGMGKLHKITVQLPELDAVKTEKMVHEGGTLVPRDQSDPLVSDSEENEWNVVEKKLPTTTQSKHKIQATQ